MICENKTKIPKFYKWQIHNHYNEGLVLVEDIQGVWASGGWSSSEWKSRG